MGRFSIGGFELKNEKSEQLENMAVIERWLLWGGFSIGGFEQMNENL